MKHIPVKLVRKEKKNQCIKRPNKNFNISSHKPNENYICYNKSLVQQLQWWHKAPRAVNANLLNQNKHHSSNRLTYQHVDFRAKQQDHLRPTDLKIFGKAMIIQPQNGPAKTQWKNRASQLLSQDPISLIKMVITEMPHI